MKFDKTKSRKTMKIFSFTLVFIAVALFAVTAWLQQPDKEEPLTAEEKKEINQEIEETSTSTTTDEELTEEDLAEADAAIDAVDTEEENPYEDPDTYVTDEEKQIYADFYPQLEAFSTQYDAAWDKLWGPAIEMAETDPEGAVDLLITLAAAYDEYGKNLRALPFPSELDETDASDFDLATDRFAEAMDERNKAAIFAGAAIKQGVLTSDATMVFIKDASARADSKMIDAAATFTELSAKYDYAQ